MWRRNGQRQRDASESGFPNELGDAQTPDNLRARAEFQEWTHRSRLRPPPSDADTTKRKKKEKKNLGVDVTVNNFFIGANNPPRPASGGAPASFASRSLVCPTPSRRRRARTTSSVSGWMRQAEPFETGGNMRHLANVTFFFVCGVC